MNYNKKITDTNIRIGPVRFSYANVFSPRVGEDGKPGKYGVCVLIPKTDTETVALVTSAYEAARELGKTTAWNGKIPAKVTSPLRDGDIEREDDAAFAGCWFFNANAKNRPGVRVLSDGIISEALDSEDFYSGCYGAVSINLYPYNSSGNVGVGVGLNNIIKTKDGERLSGGRTAEADFADLADVLA